MRPEGKDQAFLWDMREAAGDISKTVLELSAQEFVDAKFTRLAVERLAIILGEAAAKLSEPYRLAHPEMGWRRIQRLRNSLAHEYGEGQPWSSTGPAGSLLSHCLANWTLELPAERVQEFLIRDWDAVYCQAWLFKHLPRDRWYDFRERHGWEDLEVYPEPYEGLLRRTWQRLFDPQRAPGHSRYRKEAVVETLHREDVIKAQPFRGMDAWKKHPWRKGPTPESAGPAARTS